MNSQVVHATGSTQCMAMVKNSQEQCSLRATCGSYCTPHNNMYASSNQYAETHQAGSSYSWVDSYKVAYDYNGAYTNDLYERNVYSNYACNTVNIENYYNC